MKRSKIITLLVLRSLRVVGCLSVLVVSLNLSAATRIAIVSEKAGKLPDLLTAELSNVDGVELLDRSDIRKVLKEHKISAQMLDSKQALKLNKLLKTDLFVVVESEQKSKKPIGLVVFDANTGVRYWDSALPEEKDNGGNPPAKFATDAVKQALGKRDKALEGKLKYISLLGVRNADLPRDKDPFCKAVGILLMRKLGNSPDISVLERTYLDWLNKERNLSGMEWSNKLLSSNILLELEISKKEKGVKGTLFLPDKSKLTAEGTYGEVSKLAENLAGAFAKNEKIDLSKNKISLKNEARRFMREFDTLFGHKKYKEALIPLQTAGALNPKIGKPKIVEGIMTTAINILDPGGVHYTRSYTTTAPKIEESLALAELGLEMSQQVYWLNPEKSYPLDEMLSPYLKKLLDIRNFSSLPARIQEQIRDFQTRLLKLRKMLSWNKWMKRNDFKVTDASSMSDYSGYVGNYQSISFYFDNDQWIDSCFPVFCEWLKVLEDYAIRKGLKEGNTVPGRSSMILNDLTVILTETRNGRSGISKAGGRKLNELYKRMRKHPSVPVRLVGILGNLNYDACFQKKDISQSQMPARFLSGVKKEFEKLEEGKKDVLDKYASYEIIRSTQFWNGSDKSISYKANFLHSATDFMLSRNEIYPGLVLSTNQFLFALREYHKTYALIQRTENMLKSGNYTLVSERGYRKRRIATLSARLNSYKKRLFARCPDLNKNMTCLWDRKIEFFNGYEKKKGLLRVAGGVISGETLYAMGFGRDTQSYMQLLSFSLVDGKKKEVSPKYPLTWTDRSWRYDNIPVKEACITDGKYFVSTSEFGILIFSLKEGKLEKIDKSNGLPSNWVQSIACSKGIIYAGIGEERKESYFISYNPKTKKLNLLASSQSVEKKSPLDRVKKPYFIRGIVSDVKKNRLLMFVDFQQTNPEEKSGLWEYRIKEKKWNLILPVFYGSSSMNIRRRGNTILLSSLGWCAVFDPETDNTELVYCEGKNHQTKVTGDSKLIGVNSYLVPPFMIADGKLWSANLSFSCLSLETGKEILIPNPNKSHHFAPSNIFKSIEKKNDVLVGDSKSLFLLKLKEKNE